ncbi:MAG: phosphatidylcholine/phosphatidylserine synthase [Rhizobiales bacterium]|nr:phosphatidylcholine/phosphatidylserine synthase [Hyphomicrobiales bacterium]
MSDSESSARKSTLQAKSRVMAAWAVHAFTASGVITALLAVIALVAGDLRQALLWLGAALIIDGFDGPMARRVGVSEVVPRFDGAILDLVIDYLTYAVIPALMVFFFAMVPAGWGIAAAAYIMTTSLYCFGNRDMKTEDNYFSGFPAVWNIVVLYFFIFGSPAWLNLLVILALGVLTFIPVKFIHPFRVVALRRLTLVLTALWAGLTFWLVWVADGSHAPAALAPLAFWAWLATSLYFLGFCLWRTFQSARSA